MNTPNWFFFIIVIISALYIGTSTSLNLKGLDSQTLNKIKNKYAYNENISNVYNDTYYKKLEPPLQENHTKNHEEKCHDSITSKIDDYFYTKLFNYFLISTMIYISIVIFGICILLGRCDYFKSFFSHGVNVPPRRQEQTTQSGRRTTPTAIEMRNIEAPQPAVPSERRELSLSPIEHLSVSPRNVKSLFFTDIIIPPERGIRPQQTEMESENVGSANVSEMNVQRSLVQADQRRESRIRTDVQRTVEGNVPNEQSLQILAHSSHDSKTRGQIDLPTVVHRLLRLQSHGYEGRSQSRSRQSRKYGICHYKFRQSHGRRTRSQSRSRQCQAYDSKSYSIYVQQQYDADNSS